MNYSARVLYFNEEDAVKRLMQDMGCDPAGISIMAPKSIVQNGLYREHHDQGRQPIETDFFGKRRGSGCRPRYR